MASRQNKGKLYAMKKSVAALIRHYSENDDDEACHKYCPIAKDSWCKFQGDKLNGTKIYKNTINTPATISDIFKPIFSAEDLGADKLLERCLDGETQNVNESLHNVIWTRCPKSVNAGRSTHEIAVASAVLYFNDRGQGILEVVKN